MSDFRERYVKPKPRTVGNSSWRVKLNGTPLAATEDVSELFPNPFPAMLGKAEQPGEWQVPAALLSDGANQIEVTLASGEGNRINYLDLGVA